MAVTLKLKCAGEIYRLTLRDPSYESVLRAIAKAQLVLSALKYIDDEGDLCTLSAVSFSDFLELQGGQGARVLHLQAVEAGKESEAASEKSEEDDDEAEQQEQDVPHFPDPFLEVLKCPVLRLARNTAMSALAVAGGGAGRLGLIAAVGAAVGAMAMAGDTKAAQKAEQKALKASQKEARKAMKRADKEARQAESRQRKAAKDAQKAERHLEQTAHRVEIEVRREEQEAQKEVAKAARKDQDQTQPAGLDLQNAAEKEAQDEQNPHEKRAHEEAQEHDTEAEQEIQHEIRESQRDERVAEQEASKEVQRKGKESEKEPEKDSQQEPEKEADMGSQQTQSKKAQREPPRLYLRSAVMAMLKTGALQEAEVEKAKQEVQYPEERGEEAQQAVHTGQGKAMRAQKDENVAQQEMQHQESQTQADERVAEEEEQVKASEGQKEADTEAPNESEWHQQDKEPLRLYLRSAVMGPLTSSADMHKAAAEKVEQESKVAEDTQKTEKLAQKPTWRPWFFFGQQEADTEPQKPENEGDKSNDAKQEAQQVPSKDEAEKPDAKADTQKESDEELEQKLAVLRGLGVGSDELNRELLAANGGDMTGIAELLLDGWEAVPVSSGVAGNAA